MKSNLASLGFRLNSHSSWQVQNDFFLFSGSRSQRGLLVLDDHGQLGPEASGLGDADDRVADQERRRVARSSRSRSVLVSTG